MRDYQTEGIVWDGIDSCEHEWGSEKRIKYNAIHQGEAKRPWQEAMNFTEKNLGAFCSSCNAWRGSLGLEPIFQLYLQHLLQIFDEVKRVLKKTGTCWINLADTYGGSGNGSWNAPIEIRGKQYRKTCNIDQEYLAPPQQSTKQFTKSLLLIPQRFTIDMVDRGWILRNIIIWKKPNCMPSSAKDRFTVDFEYVFFFVKSKKYYFEQQFESHKSPLKQIERQKRTDNKNKYSEWIGGGGHSGGVGYNKQGRNKRTVWIVITQPFKEAHFATFPEALIEPMIKAGCPEFVCRKCGRAREKIIEREIASKGVFTNKNTPKESFTGSYVNGEMRGQGQKLQNWRNEHPDKFLGYTDCGCNVGFDGGIVLDPFIGSGTTAVVAIKNNRHFIGIDLNASYCEMAVKRIKDCCKQLNLNL